MMTSLWSKHVGIFFLFERVRREEACSKEEEEEKRKRLSEGTGNLKVILLENLASKLEELKDLSMPHYVKDASPSTPLFPLLVLLIINLASLFLPLQPFYFLASNKEEKGSSHQMFHR